MCPSLDPPFSGRGGHLRVVVVDDEALAREKLRGFLASEPEVEIVAECNDGVAATEAILRLKPDLVFLDIQLPRLNGFEVLGQIGAEEAPFVIFVTAYDRFALQAFEVHACDYLLKPYTRERFAAALGQARRTIAVARRPAWERQLKALLRGTGAESGFPARFLVKTQDQYVWVQTDQIESIHSADNYIAVHAGGRRFMLRQTMAMMEKRLDPELFLRVRASTIVNLGHVTAIRPWAGTEYELVLKSGQTVVTTRNYRSGIRALILS